MKRLIGALVSLVFCAAGAQANLVRVYYPEGHYLGCGTPAADGSGIWTYDARVPESECHDRLAPHPVSPYVSASTMGDFHTIAAKAFDSTTAFTAVGTVPFHIERVSGGTQAGVGMLVPITDRIDADLGFSAGNGSVTRVAAFEGRAFFTDRTDFRILTGTIAARAYLGQSDRVKPWLSAGARGIALRPSRSDTHPTGDASLITGAGVDVMLTPQIGIGVSGNHGFSSGWQIGAMVAFNPWRRPFPWPPPCPPGEPPPCWEWPPFPSLPFPFPYPGDAHARALDEALAALQNGGAVPSTGGHPQSALTTAVAAARHSIESRGLGAAALGAYQTQLEHPTPNITSVTQLPDFDRFSKGQQKYFIEVEKMTESEVPSFEGLGRRALKELGPTQAQPVLAAASVAQGSIAYWHVRGQAWEDALDNYRGPNDPGPANTISWRHVFKADLFGAIGGAIGSAVTGGGVVAGAVGGAIGGSVSDLLQQVFP